MIRSEEYLLALGMAVSLTTPDCTAECSTEPNNAWFNSALPCSEKVGDLVSLMVLRGTLEALTISEDLSTLAVRSRL